ncbi:MAG TPA: hypothetical protein VJ066_05520 [Candidatus Bathyarchaeia archaeon]|nr:hypothetical protein [Candidatus Bathyarchaeia archaeon]
MKECDKIKRLLDSQQLHWNKMYSEDPDFFGDEPTYPAKKAAEAFKGEGKSGFSSSASGKEETPCFLLKMVSTCPP